MRTPLDLDETKVQLQFDLYQPLNQLFKEKQSKKSKCLQLIGRGGRNAHSLRSKTEF